MSSTETKDSKGQATNGAKMSFLAHLTELRKRLIYSFIAIGIGFGIAYYFSQQIFRVLMSPLIKVMPQGSQLIFTALPEAFFTYLKVGLYGGIILALPVIFYQLWAFIAPGLYRNEKRLVIPFIFFSTALFLTGGFFGYFVVFPFGFQYFVSFADDYLRAMPSVKEYFSLAITLLFGFGLVFELPLILVFMGKMGLVSADTLARGRKWAILLIFIVAAILTPPDVLSQLLMAFPLMILYEISIVLVRIMGRPKAVQPEADKGLSQEEKASVQP